jgi:glycosyltransferase involved in cell wall biosynthesis
MNQTNDYASIILVTWRKGLHERAEMAERSITSVLKNTDYPFELILIDNTENNRGLGTARNLGISQATGKWMVIMDDDIEVKEKWLSTCIKMLEEVPGKYMVTPVYQPKIFKWKLDPVAGYQCNYRTGSNCMITKTENIIRDIGLFQELSTAQTGVEFMNRQIRLGYKVLITPQPLATDLGSGLHSYA